MIRNRNKSCTSALSQRWQWYITTMSIIHNTNDNDIILKRRVLCLRLSLHRGFLDTFPLTTTTILTSCYAWSSLFANAKDSTYTNIYKITSLKITRHRQCNQTIDSIIRTMVDGWWLCLWWGSIRSKKDLMRIFRYQPHEIAKLERKWEAPKKTVTKHKNEHILTWALAQ
jgi:hypothetical protein